MAGAMRAMLQNARLRVAQACREATARDVAKASASGAGLWAVGDVVAQHIERQNKPSLGWRDHDVRRTVVQAAYGGLVLAPVGHYWYIGLDAAVAATVGTASRRVIPTKVALDLGVFGPLHLLGFLLWNSVVGHGQSLGQAVADARQEFPVVLAADTTFWAPVQIANFTLMPVRMQLAFVNAACGVDACFLSFLGEHPGFLQEKAREFAEGIGYMLPLGEAST